MAFQLPGVFNGIDFSNRDEDEVERRKQERDNLIEIDIFSDLTDDKLVDIDSNNKENDMEKSMVSIEDVDNIIENENVEEFWSKQGLSKLNTFNLKLIGEKKDKKWAVKAGEKENKEYDRIRANLAYQVINVESINVGLK